MALLLKGKAIEMVFERLTWIGFMIVAAGWALLFSSPQLGYVTARLSGQIGGSGGLNFALVAQSVILCGLGIAIIGALQTGFGALNKFFEAVMARSQPKSGRGQAQAPAPQNPASRPSPSLSPQPPLKPQPQPAKAVSAKAKPENARKILERGWVKDRAYVQFADGSVEVETLLGRRMFPSLQEAQEFIA
ncbi:hypothetical protein [Methylocella silvestris]|uniref:Uncharacterized protein n=1 Tax=Methylocella silvestris TaxID=199596 RepID=A0A2J7TMF2_METSI|nr:hypothetical protein [Methylocella silvestris]PNG27956.1 hypothetical protein CR492_03465 [Methylocella silvestris]